MAQVISTGKSAQQLISAGAQTTNQGIPVGQIYEDGVRRYRWAHHSAKSKRGAPLLKNALAKSAIVISANKSWTSVGAGQGFGNTIGDHVLNIHSCVSLTGSRFQGGFLIIKGSGWNTSCAGVYEIDTYQSGQNAKTTKLFLKDGINGALGVNPLVARGLIVPNPYYGLTQNDGTDFISGNFHGPSILAGVTTCSSTASGYQLIQTRGPGLVHNTKTGVIAAGEAIAVVGSQFSTIVSSVPAIGRALTAPGGKTTYFTADLFIE